MWAGGRVRFLRPIIIGATIDRTSEIISIDQKHGRSGPLVLTTVRHIIGNGGGPCVEDVITSYSIHYTKLYDTQNDILKEYIAQKEWVFPVRPSVRIVRDTITYGAEHMRRYNPVNISGYHISEAGATAVQEIAFTMADTIAYVEEVVKIGISVDEFAPRLSFFFVSQADFFEEIAKFRA